MSSSFCFGVFTFHITWTVDTTHGAMTGRLSDVDEESPRNGVRGRGNHTWDPYKEWGGLYWEGFVWQADMLPYKEIEKSVGGGATGIADILLLWSKWAWLTCMGAGRMQGSRLDFMKRKEAKHTAERVGGKGEWQQEEWKRYSNFWKKFSVLHLNILITFSKNINTSLPSVKCNIA